MLSIMKAALAFRALLAGSVLILSGLTGAHAADINWVSSWHASPEPTRAPTVTLNNQTVRQVVRVTLGGSKVRVKLSNEFGETAVRIGAAHIALAGEGTTIQVGSGRALTFSGGAKEVIIPEHAYVYSDPVDLVVPAMGQLAISFHVPGNERIETEHFFALQDAWIVAKDATAAPVLTGATLVSKRLLLSGVEVDAGRRSRVVVAIGDSTTGGFGSTPNTNRRWTDVLAERLAQKKSPIAVINAGIGGNRLLHDFIGPNVLSRFDRDVLSQPGVSHVVVLIGINDFGLPGGRKLPQEEVTVQQMVAGFRQLITRAHDRGVKVIGATVLPFGPIPERPGYYSEESAAKREALNQWIRSSREFDGIIDFEAAVRDPKDAKKMLPAFDSGDHLSPNDEGYKAMGNAIDLKLFD
jgi:lysophospholipase L1-like esterase